MPLPMPLAAGAITINDEMRRSFGPKMMALTPMRQLFILFLMVLPRDNPTEAARLAGFGSGGVVGPRMMHEPAVQAAMHEEALKQLNGAKLIVTRSLIEIATSSSVEIKDRLKAMDMILSRVGMAAVTKVDANIVVEVRTREEVIGNIKRISETLGIDAQKLLGSSGIIDAEFAEVPVDADNLDDVL